MTKTAADFRIADIETARVSGKLVKVFKAFKKVGDAFVFAGEFSAPAKFANKDLWQIAHKTSPRSFFLSPP